MSRIDDLLADLCPNGVDFQPLGEIGQIFRGRRFTKADYVESGGLPSVHYGEIYTSYGTSASAAVRMVRADLRNSLRFAQPDDVIIAEVGETVEDVGKAVAWLGDHQVAVHDGCFVFRSDLDPRFVAYYTQTRAFNAEKERHVSRAKVKRLRLEGIKQIPIPVPPRHVQDEVVRILDTFERLEAELEAEAGARRQQYAHYRSSLLVPDQANTETVALGKVATLKYGYTASAADVGDYRLIRITDIADSGTLSHDSPKYVTATSEMADYLARRGDLFVARTGATYGKCVHIREDTEAIFASFLIRIRVDTDRLLPRYYWHFAQTERYWRQARALSSHGGQPQFNGNALKAVMVPVPSLQEQRQAVEVLDSFDALVNDTSIGLPAEMAARRKQYEHYRDRLLTFGGAA